MVFTVTQMSLSLSVHCITDHTVAFTYYISSWEVGHILCTSIAGSLRTVSSARQREDRCRVRPNIWYCSSAGMIDRDLIEWERKYLFVRPSQVGSSIERRKSRSELKVEGVCNVNESMCGWYNSWRRQCSRLVDGNEVVKTSCATTTRKDTTIHRAIDLCWGPRGPAHGRYKLEE